MCQHLETRSDKSISSDSLCNLASIILNNNYVENEKLKYHQKRGFTIGTKFTPPYSNFLWQWVWTFSVVSISWWDFLYIDLWILNCIKNLHPTIKFTMDYSTSIDKLETDLYCKPNDTHLHFMHNDVTIMCIKDLMHKRIWSIEKKTS